MQKKKSCADCAYSLPPTSHWLRILLTRYFPGLLLCFNHPDCPGQMAETFAHCQACRNFREKSNWGERHTVLKPNKKGVRYIPLTQNQVAMVDAEDFEELNKYRWYAAKQGNNYYAYRSGGRGRQIPMHRQIMHPPDDMVVDHIDGNGLNNCKSNLRICTKAQNTYNSRPKGDTCGFKGVSRVKRTGKYRAVIGYKGDLTEIGEFVDPVDAARARDLVAMALQGEHAWLNLPAEIRVRQQAEPAAEAVSDGQVKPVAEEVMQAVRSAILRARRKHPRYVDLSGRVQCRCHAGANLTVLHGPPGA